MLKSDFAYAAALVRAGISGVSSARRSTPQVRTAGLAPEIWGGAVAGAAFAILSSGLSPKAARRRTAAVGCVIGSALGVSAVLAWRSRGLTRSAARNAVSKINAVRDARWLEKNPIAYA
jgi:hypothetical protein